MRKARDIAVKESKASVMEKPTKKVKIPNGC